MISYIAQRGNQSDFLNEFKNMFESSFSFSGFFDYSHYYEGLTPLWILIGVGIFLGTVISVIPQILSIVTHKSSYGINSFTVLLTNVSQYFVVINFVCLHAPDFVGILQINYNVVMQRFLTFFNVFSLWFCYAFIPFLNMVFFDINVRCNRNEKSITRDKKIVRLTMTIILCFYLAGIAVPYSLGFKYGFTSDQVVKFGEVLGSICAFTSFVQYLPQIYTVIRLREHGSLSLIMLGIQAPGGIVNSLFMWLGQHEHWTTWLSFFVSASEQFILLTICIIFKIKNRKESENEPLLNDNSMTSMY